MVIKLFKNDSYLERPLLNYKPFNSITDIPNRIIRFRIINSSVKSKITHESRTLENLIHLPREFVKAKDHVLSIGICLLLSYFAALILAILMLLILHIYFKEHLKLQWTQILELSDTVFSLSNT